MAADTVDMDQAKPDVKFWLSQIEGAQKWHSNYFERGQAVIDRYMDQKSDGVLNAKASHKMNMLWSNVQTTTPALYAKSATPKVQRRFRDKDDVGRWAAVVLERVASYELDANDDDYHYRTAINDYLLPGRGQVWVGYSPTIQTVDGGDKITWEKCPIRHIHWKDFLTNPARTWDEVWWVAKREYLTEEEAKAQRLDTANMVFSEQSESDDDKSISAGERIKKAPVWEIWSKTHGKIYFVSKVSTDLLRPAAPPGLKFDGFFPCPRPLTTTTTGDSILPSADFLQYQNQATEIDNLSQRINLLTKALRVAGVYDASQESLSRLLEDTQDNQLIPCDTYAVLAGQGGVEGSISFFPLKDIILALQQAYESREQAKAAMYEITGISDIVRGASDANETATAQQIKSQWGGLRIRDRQKEVQRFIRDVMRLKAEVHASQFQPATLKAMSNVPLADAALKQQLDARSKAQEMAAQNPQMAQQAMQANPQLQALAKPLTDAEKQMVQEPAWDDVVKLLKSNALRGFRIDIETDSTIQADEMAEKQSRTEFVTAITQFAEAWGPMIMQQPKIAPLAGELMLFATRAFPASDTLETAIEEFVETMDNMEAPPPPGEDQSKMAAVKVQAEKNQMDAQLKNKDIETKAATTIQVKQMEIGAKQQEQAIDVAVGAQEAQQQRQHEANEKGQDRMLTAHEGQQSRSAQMHEGAQSRQHEVGMRQQDSVEHQMDAEREDARESETEDKVLKAVMALAGEVKKLSSRVDRIAAAE